MRVGESNTNPINQNNPLNQPDKPKFGFLGKCYANLKSAFSWMKDHLSGRKITTEVPPNTEKVTQATKGYIVTWLELDQEDDKMDPTTRYLEEDSGTQYVDAEPLEASDPEYKPMAYPKEKIDED